MSTPARNALGRFVGSGNVSPSAVAGGGAGRNSATLDDRVMTQRLREYVKVSGKSIPVALNKAGRSACYKAIRKTPKTKLSQITADMGTPGRPSAQAYALYLSKHPGIRLDGLRAKVARMIAVKRSSIAYIAAGFFRALRAFASTVKDVTPQSIAARGYGLRARPDRKFSELFNAAPGADEMAAGPLAVASVEALDDMMAYLGRTQRTAAARFNR